MATRFYTDPTNAPTVSPAYGGTWDDTSQAVRRKLVIDTAGNNASTDFNFNEVAAYNDYILAVQFVSEPLDAISMATAEYKVAFRCLESNAKAECFLYVRIGKCDSDGGNPEIFVGFSEGTEFDSVVLTNRFDPDNVGAIKVLSQGDRLIIEVGARFVYSKVSSYNATISVTDNHATTDLGENDTDTAAYNSWIETGDTFTVASGDPPAEVVKLGPMFAFA